MGRSIRRASSASLAVLPLVGFPLYLILRVAPGQIAINDDYRDRVVVSVRTRWRLAQRSPVIRALVLRAEARASGRR